MIDVETAVAVVIGLIIGGLVFALLMYAVAYAEREFPSAGPWYRLVRVVLVLLAVLVLIGLLLNFAGYPIFRMGPRPN